MVGHRTPRSSLVLVGHRSAEFEGVREGHLGRHVAAEGVVGRRLVRDQVELLPGRRPRRLDLGGVADQGDAQRLTRCGRVPGPAERLGRILGQPVHVPDLEAAPRPCLVDLDDDRDAVIHRHGQRLGATHPTQTGGQGHGAAQAATEVLAGGFRECLVRPLEDPLGPDIDPRAGGHLAVHHQAVALELAEDVPGRPLADQVGVGDEHARRPGMRPHDTDRLARLDEQRLVALEPAKLPDDGVEGGPGASRSARPAVDDEVVGILSDLRIEVVHEHPERRFLLPAAAGQLGPAGSADGAGTDGGHGGHGGDRLPAQTGDDEVAEHPRRSAEPRPGIRAPTAQISRIRGA